MNDDIPLKPALGKGNAGFMSKDVAVMQQAGPEGRGWALNYTDMAITTPLMMKRVFNLELRALQGLVDSIFKRVERSLCCPDYSLVSKRAKSVNISIKTLTRGEISHLVIDSTGLKVFGEGEWKVRRHGTDKH